MFETNDVDHEPGIGNSGIPGTGDCAERREEKIVYREEDSIGRDKDDRKTNDVAKVRENSGGEHGEEVR